MEMDTNNNGTRMKLLTINQAADVIDGLTGYRIRQLCKSGVLPCIKAGKKYLINEQTLINYINALDKEG